MQLVLAVRVNRGESQCEIEPAPVELCEIGNKFRRGRPFLLGEPRNLRGELDIGEMVERRSARLPHDRDPS